MSFDISIYDRLIETARFKIGRDQPHFNAIDIVHSLYLLDEEITIQNASLHIVGLIKKECSSGISFILNHQIFDDTYVCSKCKEPKPVAAFRMRCETRETYFNYVNDTCIECERKIIKEYHQANKDNPVVKEKAKTRAKNWHWSNRESVLQYQKERRQTEEYKQKMKEYRAKNREKIRQQAKSARISRILESKKAA